jgi:hypothetical protein
LFETTSAIEDVPDLTPPPASPMKGNERPGKDAKIKKPATGQIDRSWH